MTNILEAIFNIANLEDFSIKTLHEGRNRANSMGMALENFIKDAFATTFEIEDENEKLKIFNKKFSWLGSQNNPPDIMIKNGDAIEVKKTQNANSNLALNSSYPKANLNQANPMVTEECRKCENWDVKDLIYCVGHTSDSKLNSLWMVYGSIYAAKHETYQRIKTTISDGIETISDVVFSQTRELGRVNQVDPLGITSLRIRGMWQIENPRRVFNYIHKQTKNDFELVCIIPIEKYDSFEEKSRCKIDFLHTKGVINIEDREIKDPNNPANLLVCKVIICTKK